MDPKQQMLRSSVVVAFFNLLGGLTGILVETSIAANLGLSVRSDTFYVAYTIPYIITNLLTATGQFSLVPFFASLESTQDENELGRGFSYVANILFLGLGSIALVGIVASPWIMHGIAPGFTHQEVEIATQLSRWLFLIIIPAGLGEVLRSFLLSRHYFALSTASGFIRNVSSIAFIVFGFHRFGVYSIVIGYMAGYLLQLLILGIPDCDGLSRALFLNPAREWRIFSQPARRRDRAIVGRRRLAGRGGGRAHHRLFPSGRDAHGFELWLQDSGRTYGIAGRQRGNGRPSGSFPGRRSQGS